MPSGLARLLTLLAHCRPMQIIELDVEDWNQFCAFSDQRVFTEIAQANASNLRGAGAVMCPTSESI
jgi:hypothetical protein